MDWGGLKSVFCGLRILRKSEVEQSERTRVSEGEICDNEVKQITRPRDSKIKEASPAIDIFYFNYNWMLDAEPHKAKHSYRV